MAAPVPLHADRGDGRTYTAADRCRSGKTSIHGGLTDGHLKLHPDLHHLDGRDRAAPIWGISEAEYRERCDPWPLNPEGELLLGVKLESPEGIAHCEEILGTPGLGFAELGPGDLSLALGYREMPRDNYPPEMQEARERV